jgi:hypothetical protein
VFHMWIVLGVNRNIIAVTVSVQDGRDYNLGTETLKLAQMFFLNQFVSHIDNMIYRTRNVCVHMPGNCP